MQAHMTLCGEQLGDYQIERKLRAGGMATLFLARKTGPAGFTRLAAIKVIHPHMSQDPRVVRMFIDEARISSRIVHPNVVHIEELGEQDGLFYLVMEYVEGCSAAQLLNGLAARGVKLPVHVAAHIALRVAEGLHAAHEARDLDGSPMGVVHRDVSPSNVLLSTAGHVKIIDFGIAKAHGRIAGTESRCLKGKLRYMSPEQAYGQDLDRRSDIYSLGVVLWELLAGERAFNADNDFALLELVRGGELRPLSEVRDDVPTELELAVRAATAMDPDHRPADAHELSRLLIRACPQAVHVDLSRLGTLVQAVRAAEEDAGAADEVLLQAVEEPYEAVSCEPREVTAGFLPSSYLVTDYEHRVPRAVTRFGSIGEPPPSPPASLHAVIAGLGSGRRGLTAAVLLALGLIVVTWLTGTPRKGGSGGSGPTAASPADAIPDPDRERSRAERDPATPAFSDPSSLWPEVAIRPPEPPPGPDPAAEPEQRALASAPAPRSKPAAAPRPVRKRPAARRAVARKAGAKAPPPAKTEPVAKEPPPDEPPAEVRIDGVTIAAQPEDPGADPPPRREQTPRGPSRIGSTPIAEGFDE